MVEFYNKHYIKIDSSDRIIDGWSDGPHSEKYAENAICINEHGGYQFRLFSSGEENPILYTMDRIPLYRWDGTQAVERTEEEIEEDRKARSAPPPTTEEVLLELAADHEARLCEIELGV